MHGIYKAFKKPAFSKVYEDNGSFTGTGQGNINFMIFNDTIFGTKTYFSLLSFKKNLYL